MPLLLDTQKLGVECVRHIFCKQLTYLAVTVVLQLFISAIFDVVNLQNHNFNLQLGQTCYASGIMVGRHHESYHAVIKVDGCGSLGEAPSSSSECLRRIFEPSPQILEAVNAPPLQRQNSK